MTGGIVRVVPTDQLCDALSLAQYASQTSCATCISSGVHATLIDSPAHYGNGNCPFGKVVLFSQNYHVWFGIPAKMVLS